jgi:hypothetical protein
MTFSPYSNRSTSSVRRSMTTPLETASGRRQTRRVVRSLQAFLV